MELKHYALALKKVGHYKSVKNFYDELAVELNVVPSLVKLWAYKQAKVGPRHVLKIEEFTKGKVHRTELRPDLYPPEEYL